MVIIVDRDSEVACSTELPATTYRRRSLGGELFVPCVRSLKDRGGQRVLRSR
jgi:hypothetical protein